jgi:3-hydroxybutyryl-CoA dehydratase
MTALHLKPGGVLPRIETTMTQERILSWARISGDYNRLHVDPEFAGQTRFKGTIAHGPMSLAFLNQLMMQVFDEGWVMGGRLLDVRFVAPIRPGDRILISGTVKRVFMEQDHGVAECELRIDKGDGETAVTGRAIGRLKEATQ